MQLCPRSYFCNSALWIISRDLVESGRDFLSGDDRWKTSNVSSSGASIIMSGTSTSQAPGCPKGSEVMMLFLTAAHRLTKFGCRDVHLVQKLSCLRMRPSSARLLLWLLNAESLCFFVSFAVWCVLPFNANVRRCRRFCVAPVSSRLCIDFVWNRVAKNIFDLFDVNTELHPV